MIPEPIEKFVIAQRSQPMDLRQIAPLSIEGRPGFEGQRGIAWGVQFQIERLHSDNERLEDEIKARQETIASLKQQVDELNSNITELVRENDNLRNDITKDEKDAELLRNENKGRENILVVYQNIFDPFVKQEVLTKGW